MKTRRELMQYYKRKMYRGRVGFSRAVDYLALRILAFMGCYMWFSILIANGVAKLLLSLAATAFISVSLDLINSFRLDKFIAAERRRAAGEGLAKRLLYLTDRERRELIREYVKARPEAFGQGQLICTAHKAAGVSEEDVLSALRSARERKAAEAYIFHTGAPTKEAAAAAASCPEVRVTLVDMRTALSPEALKRLTPTDTEVDQMLLDAARMERQRLKAAISAPFARGRTLRYVTVAAILAGLSFFVEYALYYRLMAAACICFGATSWWLNRAAGASSQG